MVSGGTVTTKRGLSSRLGNGRGLALAFLGCGTVLSAAMFAAPDHARSVVPGPMVPGHEALSCAECHREAPGTTRQQVQANVMHLAGLRASGASFGREPASTEACQGCHARENDRHPGFRFREPRFQRVNKTLDARDCLSCHSEHTGRRVSNDGMFCVACHDGMKARKEVVSPTHAELVAGGRWDSCLTCHDFHGNHAAKAARTSVEARDLRAVRAYLADGPDPYSREKLTRARKTGGPGVGAGAVP